MEMVDGRWVLGGVVHDVKAERLLQMLEELCAKAAKKEYEQRDVGLTEAQLDAIAEEAAMRASGSPRKSWKVRDGEATRRMSPFEVVKMHEKYIQKNKERANKMHDRLQEQLNTMTETMELLTEQLELLQTRVFQMNRRFQYLSSQA